MFSAYGPVKSGGPSKPWLNSKHSTAAIASSGHAANAPYGGSCATTRATTAGWNGQRSALSRISLSATAAHTTQRSAASDGATPFRSTDAPTAAMRPSSAGSAAVTGRWAQSSDARIPRSKQYADDEHNSKTEYRQAPTLVPASSPDLPPSPRQQALDLGRPTALGRCSELFVRLMRPLFNQVNHNFHAAAGSVAAMMRTVVTLAIG
ncbi:hypothetical protein T492DRAFT_838199 [Pavlovales sp. CCMP2436]|nr:hypothetical protein T492DRAFT_838199 [Pavlovales sp. CCMP2436]